MEEMHEEVIVEVAGPPTPRYDIDNEFRAYQRVTVNAEDKLDKYADDPMKFWTDNKSRFPLLYQVARRYLQIPATSVPSERVFSLAGFIVRKKRTKLLAKHVNQQIFLAKNKNHIPKLTRVFSTQIPKDPKGSDYESDGPDVDNDETQML